MKLVGKPAQLLALGTILIVEEIKPVAEFEVVKAGIFPVPFAINPIEGVSLVQSKVVPTTFPDRDTILLTWLLHNNKSLI